MKKALKVTALCFLCAAILFVSFPARAGSLVNDAGRDLLIKTETQTAVSMLQAVYERHLKGEMTLDQAKKLGADLLRQMKYGDEGYFFADTFEGVSVVLYGNKDVEGKNILEEKDANGTYYMKDLIAKAKAGGGYTEYLYMKKGEKKASPKRSYVLPFKPFGWMVGTGYYR
jgi:methyl-accepting chemotaxis protein